MANLVYERVSTDQQSTARQDLVLDEAGIEDPVVFEEDPGTSSRLHPLQRPRFRELLTYARPGDTVHISEMFRLVRGNQHILDVLDVLHRDRLALRIHDGAFSAMDLTARHPRTGELLSTVKFMMQTLAAAGELQRDLQLELTYDGLRTAEAKGSKGGRRPAVAAAKADDVRTAYLEGRSIAALARDHRVSRGAIRTAVADLLRDHSAAEEAAPAPELPVTLDMPGKIADYLRTIELEPAERPCSTRGNRTARPGLHPARQRRPRRTPPAPRPLPAARRRPGRPRSPGPAQGPRRVREPRQRPHALTKIVLTDNRCTDVPRAVLLAAALDKRPITDIMQWLAFPADRTPLDILRDHGFAAVAAQLKGTVEGPPETRDGIYETAQQYASALLNAEIAAWVTPQKDVPEFRPEQFVTSTDTLFLPIKDGGGGASALIAACADSVMRAATAQAERAGGRLDPPMLAILDEAANVCQISDLPDLYSHLGSRGIIPITILRSYRQGQKVWGDAGMDAMWSASTVKVIGSGIDDPDFADKLSRLIGDHDVETTSTSHSESGKSTSVSMRQEPRKCPRRPPARRRRSPPEPSRSTHRRSPTSGRPRERRPAAPGGSRMTFSAFVLR